MAALPPIVGKITFTDDGATATLGKVSTAATQTATATKAVGDQAKAAVPNLGAFGSTVGLLGGTVGRLNSGMGQTVGVVAQALGSFQSLATMGLGPVGIAIGAVSAFVTAGTALWTAHTEQLERARVRMDEITAASVRFREEQRQTTLSIQASNEEFAASGRSLLTREGRAYAMAQERARLAQVDADLNAQTLRRIQLEIEAAGLDRPGAGGGGGGGGRAASGGAPLSDENAQFQLEADLARANAANADATFNRLGGDGGDDFLKQLAQEREDELEIEQNHYERMRELTESELEKRRAIEEENAAQLQEINDSVFSAVESGLQSSVDAWLSGSATIGEAAMNMARGTAKALASEAIVEGLKQTALGIGNSIFNPPAAAANFASAATWAAVGVAAGALGAATGAFGAQGGGASSAAASPQAGPALDGGATERGGDVYNINWGSAGLVYAADKAQLGRDLEDLIAGSRSRLGRAA